VTRPRRPLLVLLVLVVLGAVAFLVVPRVLAARRRGFEARVRRVAATFAAPPDMVPTGCGARTVRCGEVPRPPDAVAPEVAAALTAAAGRTARVDCATPRLLPGGRGCGVQVETGGGHWVDVVLFPLRSRTATLLVVDVDTGPDPR
jgi:hypothetical protein